MATILELPVEVTDQTSFIESMRETFNKNGIKYVRIPTSETCERSTIKNSSRTKLAINNSAAFLGLLTKLSCIAVFLVGRKFGPTLLLSFVVYLYFSSLFAISLILGDLMRALYNVCDNLLYHPEQPETSRTNVILPSSFNLPYEEIMLKTSDKLRLHCYFLKQENCGSCPTVLYLHGNAGNIGHRLPHAQGLFHSMKVNIFLLEYRGYGRSEGVPSEKGLYKDAQASLEYLTNHAEINRNLIFVFGRSLGGAVAINLASNPKNASNVAALIVENTFTSIPSLARVIISLRFIRYVPRLFYKSVFASEDRIENIRCPVLFISGLADTLIPPTMMRSLFTKCGSTFTKLATFESGTHNQTWQCRGYKEACKDFFDAVTKGIEEKKRTGLIMWPTQNQMIHYCADIV